MRRSVEAERVVPYTGRSRGEVGREPALRRRSVGLWSRPARQACPCVVEPGDLRLAAVVVGGQQQTNLPVGGWRPVIVIALMLPSSSLAWS